MAKYMIVSHLDSSKSERCAVKFSKMFLARHKGPDIENKIFLKFWDWKLITPGLDRKTSGK